MDDPFQVLHVGPIGVAVILLAISAIYFCAGRDQPMARRFLKSSHGVLLLFQMTPIIARDFLSGVHGDWVTDIYYGSLVFGLIAAAYSVRHFARPWYFHSLHVFTVLYGALANIYGWQAIVTNNHWSTG